MGVPRFASSALRVTCQLFLLIVLFAGLARPRPVSAEPVPPRHLFMPLMIHDVPQPTVQKFRHWSNLSQQGGAFGMVTRDWDGAGKPEVFVADKYGISTWRDLGQYRFDQVWAAPGGVGWGFQNLDGDPEIELWVVGADGRVLAYDPFSYTPWEVGRVPSDITAARVGNLLGDGQLQLVTVTADGLIRSYPWPALPQTPRWQRTAPDCPRIADLRRFVLLQADADPQLEIALGCGLVIDPWIPAEDWRWQEELDVIAAGNLDDDPYDELVGAERTNGGTRVFDVNLRALAWQPDADRPGSLLVANVTGDALPELLTSRGPSVGPAVYDARTHKRIWSPSSADTGGTGIGAGDADGNGQVDILWASLNGGANGPQFLIAPFAPTDPNAGPVFWSMSPIGPPSLAALQLDDDAALEIVRFASPSLYNRNAVYSIVDGVTGLDEPNLSLALPPVERFFVGPLGLLQGDIDADKQDELLVAGEYTLYVLDHNGKSLAQQPSPNVGFIPDWLGDADGDGQPEVVGHDALHIIVLALPTLMTRWTSQAWPDGVWNLQVVDVDQDGRLEAVFHGRDKPLKAYEFGLGRVDWEMGGSEGARAFTVGAIDATGNNTIVTIAPDNRLRYYDARTLGRIATGPEVPYDGSKQRLHLVRLLNGDTPQLVVLAGGALVFRKPLDGVPFFWTSVNTPDFTFLLADLDADRRVDMLLAGYPGMERWEWGDRVLPVR